MNLVYASDEDKKQGWTLCPGFLIDVQNQMLKGMDLPAYAPSTPMIEGVLLAAAKVNEKREGESD